MVETVTSRVEWGGEKNDPVLRRLRPRSVIAFPFRRLNAELSAAIRHFRNVAPELHRKNVDSRRPLLNCILQFCLGPESLPLFLPRLAPGDLRSLGAVFLRSFL